jgi:hypothetical protein
MSADATDLRFHFAEHLGDSEVLTASAVVAASRRLLPGRYRVRFLGVAGGATRLWVRQGAFGGVVAAAVMPSTPFDLTISPYAEFTTMARPGAVDNANARPGTDGLSFITDAGTVTVVITRISREA